MNVDAISSRAYQIWEQEGRPHGRDLEHWAQAEAELVSAARQTEEPTKNRRRQK